LNTIAAKRKKGARQFFIACATTGEPTTEDVQEAAVLDVSAEAEVDELSVRAAAAAEQDVLQLDVAVHDVRPVHVLHLHERQARGSEPNSTAACTLSYVRLLKEKL